jgi:hypothetical protein
MWLIAIDVVGCSPYNTIQNERLDETMVIGVNHPTNGRDFFRSFSRFAPQGKLSVV